MSGTTPQREADLRRRGEMIALRNTVVALIALSPPETRKRIETFLLAGEETVAEANAAADMLSPQEALTRWTAVALRRLLTDAGGLAQMLNPPPSGP